MPVVKVEGVPPWDGSYHLDLSSLNGRELHLIKQVAGVRGNELQDALMAGDYDLVVAFTMIAIQRSGKPAPTADELLDADVGKLIFDDDPAEADARPPESATPNGSGVNDGQSEPLTPSGETSDETGESHQSGLSFIGAHGSVESADSAPATSAT